MGGEFPQVFTDHVLSQRPFYSLDSFYEGLGGPLDMQQDEVRRLWPAELVRITSDYFQLQLQVTLGESRLQIDSILGRFDRNNPVVISRTISVIPSLAGRLDGVEELTAVTEQGFCTQLENRS